ncbi:diaminopimelate decarboxylase [Amycolatopsis endophytica]|uniref:Diaminopimelate decarboxylase n=1 Tax=Amycolatopsis endophytica TaxID=860233 RepID=A0A853BD99_9PSEU|nr:diaminopimelate decarboxylase [Amycolatopsis endophytica]NYI92641.1 diaminopimelate decarboxylase [Amycolatopsis endophytica]
MTLAEVLPSVGLAGEPPLDPGLWPVTTRIADGGDLTCGGVSLVRLAARFGTPVQVFDEAEIRRRAALLRTAFPDAEIAFATKALPVRGILRRLDGFSADVCSAGEIALARSAGVPGERILVHGNVKTPEDLKAAFAAHAGRIVADSADEIDQLAALAPAGQRVLVRVTPGVDAHTHHALATAVEGQKFGLSLASGAALDAVGHLLAQPGLRAAGLHCHLGSQVRGTSAYEEAARRMVGLLAQVRDRHGVTLDQLDLGGGFTVPYRPGEGAFDLTGAARRVLGTLRRECDRHRLPVPRLVLEPGRWLVATAGITLYRVAAVKGGFVAVDGGMSDNPRPALYGARYTARLVGRHTKAPRRPVTIAGRHCEAGDLLAEDVPLPADVRAGDLLAVPVSGAYHHALASNYNLVGRPPLIAVADGAARVLVRRETEEDLLRRDLG